MGKDRRFRPRIDFGNVPLEQWINEMEDPELGNKRFGGTIISFSPSGGRVYYEVCQSKNPDNCKCCQNREACREAGLF